MTLDTMAPNPVWNASDHLKTVTTLSKIDASFVFKIWCDDGCKDCRAQLPDFSAALSAANINPNCIEQYSVNRLPGGKKQGPLVEEYGISRIPTIILEQKIDATSSSLPFQEIARYVEFSDLSAADYLSEMLSEHLDSTTYSE
jgi:hypothetical protein